MSGTASLDTPGAPDAPGEVLAAARDYTAAAAAAERGRFVMAVQWAGMHSADSLDEAATWALAHGGEGAVLIAGVGAPLVAEFCIPELAAAVGMSHDAGKAYLGDAIEVRYRLTGLWARVLDGTVPVWRARRVAQQTMSLSEQAAAFVDRHVAPVAHKIGPAQLDRLIEEARVRHDPAEAERLRVERADSRHLDVRTDQVGFDGTVHVEGELDLADALDLDAALSAGAQHLADLGCAESLDVRRSMAAGELARTQLTLDLEPTDDTDDTDDTDAKPGRGQRPRRDLTLYVHLSEAAITGVPGEIARVENTRSLVSPEQVRQWCAVPGARITVKPVIDLTGHVHTDAVEVTARLREQVVLTHHTCVFPRCTRPARRTECDHREPRARGGPGCVCNTAPLCRRHHRLKTHGGWSYTQTDPTTFIWTSPYGYRYQRDHTGTTDISPDRPA